MVIDSQWREPCRGGTNWEEAIADYLVDKYELIDRDRRGQYVQLEVMTASGMSLSRFLGSVSYAKGESKLTQAGSRAHR